MHIRSHMQFLAYHALLIATALPPLDNLYILPSSFWHLAHVLRAVNRPQVWLVMPEVASMACVSRRGCIIVQGFMLVNEE